MFDKYADDQKLVKFNAGLGYIHHHSTQVIDNTTRTDFQRFRIKTGRAMALMAVIKFCPGLLKISEFRPGGEATTIEFHPGTTE